MWTPRGCLKRLGCYGETRLVRSRFNRLQALAACRNSNLPQKLSLLSRDLAAELPL